MLFSLWHRATLKLRSLFLFPVSTRRVCFIVWVMQTPFLRCNDIRLDALQECDARYDDYLLILTEWLPP